MRKHVAALVLAALVFVITLATAVIPAVEDVIPPQYNGRYYLPPTTQRLYQPLSLGVPLQQGQAAHQPFSDYYFVKSDQISEGSEVQGSITFYYMNGVSESLNRVLYVFLEREYRVANFDNVGTLSVYVWSSATRCCDDSRHYGWTSSFRFRSNETGSYVFLFHALYAESLEVILHIQVGLRYVTIEIAALGVILALSGLVGYQKSGRRPW